MKFLSSGFPPLKLGHQNFNSEFERQLSESICVDMAVAYISEKSLEYLVDCIHREKTPPSCNLAIGMHFFDGFTRSQYAAARDAERFLKDNKLGSIKLVKSFPFHGKLYSFQRRDGKISSLVGSSNLNNIRKYNPIRQYECDFLVEDQDIGAEISRFVGSLLQVSEHLCQVNISNEDFKQSKNLLEGLQGVKTVSPEVVENALSSQSEYQRFELPLKTSTGAPNSNLNVYFGKGRENKETQVVQGRHWYEVELIVSKNITNLPGYPTVESGGSENRITVVTDDGYQFDCKISGTNSKNFRSADDLTVLGRWIKGRLESEGVLSMGDRVTDDVLKNYGRSNASLSFVENENVWFLDFSVRKT